MPYIDATTQAWAASSPVRAYKHDGSALTGMSWFCGAGGDTQGADAVPGVQVTRAANHWDVALATHTWNNPDCDVWKGDIRRAPVEKWPVCQLFWASPECPKWSAARGVKRDFDRTMQGDFDFEEPEFKTEKERRAAEERSRALMEEVPM
ncbi:DNA cytosine methyltransferase, partial [Streptomyces sp. MCAF7]